eukprot:m.95338 g.95338  ORF g.95338 m.95338 type:complete len:763 (-) comp26811_c0_seq2:352-2640(-)
MESLQDAKLRLTAQEARLNGSDGELSGRIKKRIMAKIGALRKKIATMSPTATATASSTSAPPPTSQSLVSDGGAQARGKRKRDSPPPHVTTTPDSEGGIATEAIDPKRNRVGDTNEANSSAPTKFQPTTAKPLNKQAKKKKILLLNKQLGQLAQRKQLASAKKVFAKADKKGLVDSHSFANLMNAHVRCGDTAGSEKLLQQLRERGMRISVVTYTIHLKGLCSEGLMDPAFDLLDEMMSGTTKVELNIRTINTMLRGCVRVGAIDRAISLTQKMQSTWKISPDASSYEYIACLMSNGLQLEGLRELIVTLRTASAQEEDTQKDHKQKASASLSGEADAARNPAMYLYYGRAAALLGEWSQAEQALEWCEAELDFDKFLKRHKAQTEQSTSANPKEGKLDDIYANKRVRAAIRQFARHRLEELRREAGSVSTFVKNRKHVAQDTGDNTSFNQSQSSSITQLHTLKRGLYRTLYFRVPNTVAPTVATSMIEACPKIDFSAFIFLQTYVLKQSFGLNSCLSRLAKNSSSNKQIVEDRDMSEYYDSSDGKLEFKKIFGETAHLPLKLEVGCGTGEWAAAQAKSDVNKANWVALELRYDRVYETFSRMTFSGVENACVIGGDAMHIMQNYFKQCLQHVFVNYPEPPERTSGVADSQGQHLLTGEFFVMLRERLLPDGMVTILTDNHLYAKSLTELMCASGFTSIELGNFDADPINTTVTHDRATVHLYEGTPRAACGHVASASSYFNRMWSEGNKSKRYYICVKKIM